MDQPRPRILVVDDDADILMLLSHRLEQLGYAVSVAANGTEALAKLVSEHPRWSFWISGYRGSAGSRYSNRSSRCRRS